MLSKIKIVLLTLLYCLPLCSYSLESDRGQPLYVSADSADINNHSGIGQYQGNVTVTQGSSHLTAARATTYSNKTNQLIKAIAQGTTTQPAHYWTITDPKKPELHAYAQTIRFYPPQQLIYLIGNAKVVQGNDSYTAPTIRYDTVAEHVCSGHRGRQRTTIIIHPTTVDNPRK